MGNEFMCMFVSAKFARTHGRYADKTSPGRVARTLRPFQHLAMIATPIRARKLASHVVATANGTLALESVLRGLRIGQGDEVIVPALTFAAPASSVLAVGASVVLADISSDSWTIDPDLVAEVAASSASYDLGKKLNAYRRNGVREYVVWRVLERQVDWFVQREERFETLLPTADRILRSTVFPGLWLDPATLLHWDVNAVFAIVQQGLNSPEHADFVARLERARTV